MRLVYIAGPYRAATKEEVLANILAARNIAIDLLKALHKKPIVEQFGQHAYDSDKRSLLERLGDAAPFPVIPHQNTAMFDHEEGLDELNPEFWLEGTMDQLRGCQYVLLTRPDAGLISEGTKREIMEANRLGMPVFEDVEALILFMGEFRFRSNVLSRVKEVKDRYARGLEGYHLHLFGGPKDESQPS